MDNHRDIEWLIPWYVNGTLNETEMDTVNRHLAGCSSCTRTVEAEIGFARALRAEPAGLRRLARADAAWSEFAAGLRGRRPQQRPAPAPLLVALTLVIASGAFLAGQHLQPPAFETLTATAPHDGPVVQLMFEPSTPESVIREVVRQAGGTVIAGPTATGIYRVGLPPGSDGRAREAGLRGLPAVRWAALEGP